MLTQLSHAWSAGSGTRKEKQSHRSSSNSNNDIITADLQQAVNAAACRVQAHSVCGDAAGEASILKASSSHVIGASFNCLLFLNSTTGATDLGHSFRSFIQIAFKGK